MPTRNAQGLTTLVVNDLTLTLPAEDGYLTAVSAYEPYAARGSAELFAAFFLGSIETPRITPDIFLGSGYFGAMFYATWTGRIQLRPGTIVIGRFRSLVSTAISMTINTET